MNPFLSALAIGIAALLAGGLNMIRKPQTHRRDRRRLDPSQVPQPTPIVATVSSTGTTNVSIAFDQPVVVKDTIGIAVEDLTVSEQVVVDAQHLTLVASGNVAGKEWTLPTNDPAVRNAQGGFVAAATGTF